MAEDHLSAGIVDRGREDEIACVRLGARRVGVAAIGDGPAGQQTRRVGHVLVGIAGGGQLLRAEAGGRDFAEIAGDRLAQIGDGDGRAPPPERRRRGKRGGHENIRLQPFDRLWPGQQRDEDEAGDIAGDAPEDAMHERIEGEREQCARPQ